MRHDKLEQQLSLLLLLTQGRSYTVGHICDMLRLSPRNVYYYLDFFRETGFIVEKREGGYCIDRSSPFLRQLIEHIEFTEEEVIALHRILNKVEEDAVVKNLKRKLARFYDLEILNDQQIVEQQAKAVNALAYAIKMRRMAVLRGYSSGHSQTQRDRLVEPFLLMNNNQDVRCYEPASKLNKTFKVARMQSVEVLEEEWKYKSRHRQTFTDVFMFSSNEPVEVTLRLGTLSANLFREEYPAAIPYLKREDDSHWLLRLPVSSYQGICRFVLGLFDDIEILGDDGFKQFLSEKIHHLTTFLPSTM